MPPEATWTRETPTRAGRYEVRLDREAWGLEAEQCPRPRIVYLDPTLGRFEASPIVEAGFDGFGGDLGEGWEWRGPIEVPDLAPDA